MFRKADIILAVGLIVVGFAMSFFLASGKAEGSQVTVTADGKLYGRWSLSEDRTVDIDQKNSRHNQFQIKDGKVTMIQADCHGHDCIQQGSIDQTGETIVCLPNKVVIEITGGKQDYDTIAR